MGGKPPPCWLKMSQALPRGLRLFLFFLCCEVTASLCCHNLPEQMIPQTPSQPLIVRFGYSCPAIPRTWEFISKDNLFFFPHLPTMFNAWSRVYPSFWSKNRTGDGYTERREKASLGREQPPNPWVTTGGAQMSAYIKATGIVFKTTGAVLLSFQCAEAH